MKKEIQFPKSISPKLRERAMPTMSGKKGIASGNPIRQFASSIVNHKTSRMFEDAAVSGQRQPRGRSL